MHSTHYISVSFVLVLLIILIILSLRFRSWLLPSICFLYSFHLYILYSAMFITCIHIAWCSPISRYNAMCFTGLCVFSVDKRSMSLLYQRSYWKFRMSRCYLLSNINACFRLCHCICIHTWQHYHCFPIYSADTIFCYYVFHYSHL